MISTDRNNWTNVCSVLCKLNYRLFAFNLKCISSTWARCMHCLQIRKGCGCEKTDGKFTFTFIEYVINRDKCIFHMLFNKNINLCRFSVPNNKFQPYLYIDHMADSQSHDNHLVMADLYVFL